MAELKIAVGDSWTPKYLPYFAMAMMGLMLITNVMNLKFIDVAGYSVIASQIVYTFSLIVADIMAEVYGYKRVRRILYAAMGILVLYAVCLQTAVILPPAQDYQNDEAFKTLFSQTPRIIVASISAYFVGDLVLSFVMSRLKILFHAKYFYGRAIASVGLAQAINGAVFFGVAFWGVMPVAALVSAAGFSWMCVMLCEFCVLPLTKQLALKMKKLEGVEHYDRQPKEAA